MSKPIVVTFATVFGFASVAFADTINPNDVVNELEAEGYEDVTVLDAADEDDFLTIEATDPNGDVVTIVVNAETGETRILEGG